MSEGRREVLWLWLTASTRSQASSKADNEFEVAEGKAPSCTSLYINDHA